MLRISLMALLVTAVAFTGCRAPGSDSPMDQVSEELPRELAATPEPLPSPEQAPVEKKGARGKRAEDGRGKEKNRKGKYQQTETPPSPADAGKGPPNDGPPEPDHTPPRRLGSVSDGSGDHGPVAPSYADLRAAAISTRKDLAIITIDLAAPPPASLEDGEVMGIGFDVYRSSDLESDYQVFADGGVDGWFAYLQTPDGFVPFPGTFAIVGGQLVFQIPWDSLGGVPRGQFGTFVDWSGPGVGVSPSSQDFAPNSGTAGFEERQT